MNYGEIIVERENKIIYRDGDRTCKVFTEEYSAADVIDKAFSQALVQETGLNVPKLIEIIRPCGKWTIVSEYIGGKTLEQLMLEHPARREEYLNLFVDLQLDMHRHTVPLLCKLRDKMHRKIRASGLDATTRYELHRRLDGIKEHTKLCHGDYNPSNIVISEAGEAHILDWSHATQGNAAADAAQTYLLFWLAGDETTAEAYMKLFCKKSDTARQYVEKWLSIVSAAQLVKDNPGERALLLRWTNVVDYE
jgi:serine/threonine protein kinase